MKKNERDNLSKFINLLYLHCNEYEGFRTFNVDNVCGIYGIDKKVMNILEDSDAVRVRKSKHLRMYDWGSTPVTNAFVEDVHTKLNTKTITKNVKVMKSHVTRKRFDQNEIDYILSNPKSSNKSIGKFLGRKAGAIGRIRYRIENPQYASKLMIKQLANAKRDIVPPKDKSNSHYTDEDISFILDNPDMPSEEIAIKLNRTRASISSKRWSLRMSGKASSKPTLKVDKPREENPVRIGESLKKASATQPQFQSSPVRYKRIRIFWGLYSYESSY